MDEPGERQRKGPVERTRALTATTFQPRSLAAAPKQFGKSATDLTPAAGQIATGPKFAAAQLQHRVCNAVREALLAEGKSIDSFAEELRPTVPGVGYDRLVRVLRGETLMQIADLVTWAGRFAGVRDLLVSQETWPAPPSSGELWT